MKLDRATIREGGAVSGELVLTNVSNRSVEINVGDLERASYSITRNGVRAGTGPSAPDTYDPRDRFVLLPGEFRRSLFYLRTTPGWPADPAQELFPEAGQYQVSAQMPLIDNAHGRQSWIASPPVSVAVESGGEGRSRWDRAVGSRTMVTPFGGVAPEVHAYAGEKSDQAGDYAEEFRYLLAYRSGVPCRSVFMFPTPPDARWGEHLREAIVDGLVLHLDCAATRWRRAMAYLVDRECGTNDLAAVYDPFEARTLLTEIIGATALERRAPAKHAPSQTSSGTVLAPAPADLGVALNLDRLVIPCGGAMSGEIVVTNNDSLPAFIPGATLTSATFLVARDSSRVGFSPWRGECSTAWAPVDTLAPGAVRRILFYARTTPASFVAGADPQVLFPEPGTCRVRVEVPVQTGDPQAAVWRKSTSVDIQVKRGSRGQPDFAKAAGPSGPSRPFSRGVAEGLRQEVLHDPGRFGDYAEEMQLLVAYQCGGQISQLMDRLERDRHFSRERVRDSITRGYLPTLDCAATRWRRALALAFDLVYWVDELPDMHDRAADRALLAETVGFGDPQRQLKLKAMLARPWPPTW